MLLVRKPPAITKEGGPERRSNGLCLFSVAGLWPVPGCRLRTDLVICRLLVPIAPEDGWPADRPGGKFLAAASNGPGAYPCPYRRVKMARRCRAGWWAGCGFWSVGVAALPIRKSTIKPKLARRAGRVPDQCQPGAWPHTPGAATRIVPSRAQVVRCAGAPRVPAALRGPVRPERRGSIGQSLCSCANVMPRVRGGRDRGVREKWRGAALAAPPPLAFFAHPMHVA